MEAYVASTYDVCCIGVAGFQFHENFFLLGRRALSSCLCSCCSGVFFFPLFLACVLL